MGEVNVNISGRNYGISCQDGQEQRVIDLGQYVDERLKNIASSGAASNENHLLVLTALMLSDEVFDLRENGSTQAPAAQSTVQNSEQDEHVAQAIDQLADRIDQIAQRIEAA